MSTIIITGPLTHTCSVWGQTRTVVGDCLSSSSVVRNAVGAGRVGGREPDCTAGQYGYVPLGRHLVIFKKILKRNKSDK